MAVKNRIAEMHEEITAWRHDIHTHPELLFDTHRTSGMVAQKLREFGCDDVVEGIGRTGVVGVIKGKSDTKGRVIGLRADMDALPIHEETGAEYQSQTPNVMHACGHDGHTAMLLGAAKYLSETRNFDGTVVLIFQPAEEGGGGGREMCEDGMMARWNIQEVYGMHNWPGMEKGAFSIRSGAFFASTDEIAIKVQGRGGHAAKPHETIDSIAISAHLITALQTIVSRTRNPVKELVVSITSIESSSKAANIIADSVELKGTIRALDEEVRKMASDRIKAICEATAAMFEAQIEVEIKEGYPVTVNHPEQTAFAAEVAKEVSGKCSDADLVMGAEDFSFMLNERPGAYILMGNGDTAPLHSPHYNFDDESIPWGVSWWIGLAERGMPSA